MGEAMPESIKLNNEGQTACPVYACCLFVRAGDEERAAAEIAEKTGCSVLVPMIDREELHSGSWVRITKKLLPGYVFLYSDSPIASESMTGTNGVLKVLKYTDGRCELVGEDRRFAEWIYDNGGTVGVSTAVKEGDRIRVIDGPLLDYCGSITEVKRKKRTAKVSISFGEITREIWMSFEWLKTEEG